MPAGVWEALFNEEPWQAKAQFAKCLCAEVLVRPWWWKGWSSLQHPMLEALGKREKDVLSEGAVALQNFCVREEVAKVKFLRGLKELNGSCWSRTNPRELSTAWQAEEKSHFVWLLKEEAYFWCFELGDCRRELVLFPCVSFTSGVATQLCIKGKAVCISLISCVTAWQLLAK